MSYAKVESVNRNIAGTFYPTLAFDAGRVSDINIHAEIDSVPLCWMVPREYPLNQITQKMTRFQKNHLVELFFFKRNLMSNDNEETFQIIKDMEEIATEFVIKLADFAVSNDVEVENFTIAPQYYNHAKNLFSGVLLNYTMILPDDFNYC